MPQEAPSFDSNPEVFEIRQQWIKKMVEQRFSFRNLARSDRNSPRKLCGTRCGASCVFVPGLGSRTMDRKLNHPIPAIVTKFSGFCRLLADDHGLPVDPHWRRVRPPLGPRSVRWCSSALSWTWKKRFSGFGLFLTWFSISILPHNYYSLLNNDDVETQKTLLRASLLNSV